MFSIACWLFDKWWEFPQHFKEWRFSAQYLLILQNSHSSIQGCQAMRRYLLCVLQIEAHNAGEPPSLARQCRDNQGTCTADALDSLCHCNHNSKGRDTVRTQNILSQGRKPPQPLEKGCCHKLWLRTGKKIVFCGCHSVIVLGKLEITQKLKKPTRTHKQAHKQTKLHSHNKLRIRLFLF